MCRHPMRHYLRHPTDIPLRYCLADRSWGGRELMRNVGHGGLCFRNADALAVGTILHITIALHGLPFEADGVVVWCVAADGDYEIGVRFRDEETDFAVRMVEQACQIEHYKHEVQSKEGRRLSGEQAAVEWIERHAEDFPA